MQIGLINEINRGTPQKNRKYWNHRLSTTLVEGTATAIATRVKEDSDAVFYFIRTQDTYLALGGSIHHLMGGRPERKYGFGLSYAVWLINSLAEINRIPRLFFANDKFYLGMPSPALRVNIHGGR